MNTVKFEVKSGVVSILGLGKNFPNPVVDNGVAINKGEAEDIASLLAHDVVEHVRGISFVGGLHDEFMAIGASFYNRGFNQNVSGMAAITIADGSMLYLFNKKKIDQNMIDNVKSRNDFCTVIDAVVSKALEEVICTSRKNIAAKGDYDLIYYIKHGRNLRATDEVILKYKAKFNASFTEEYLEKMLEGMMVGYYLAHQKYQSKENMNNIFRKASDEFKKAFLLQDGVYDLVI